MKTASEMEQLLRSCKPRLQEKHPIAALALFGAYARGEQTETSDVAILVALNGPIGWEFVDIAE